MKPNKKQIKNKQKMKQKAALPAAALRSSDPVKQTAPSWKGETERRPLLGPVCLLQRDWTLEK